MIGNKIKNIRELKNLTQEFIAEKLDVSQAAYSRMENGETKITDEKLNQIAEILEVKPEDIKAFDSQKYFNSVGNVEGDNNYNGIYISENDTELIKKLYEDKIVLLEELLNQQKKIVQKYESKYGEL